MDGFYTEIVLFNLRVQPGFHKMKDLEFDWHVDPPNTKKKPFHEKPAPKKPAGLKGHLRGRSKRNSLAMVGVRDPDCVEHVLSFLDNPVDLRDATIEQYPAILRNLGSIKYRVVVPALT